MLRQFFEPGFLLTTKKGAAPWIYEHAHFVGSTLLAGHSVGEPELKKKSSSGSIAVATMTVFPSKVNILGAELHGKVPVEIEHSHASVSKENFFPVPSTRTWVCYNGANQEVSDRNIRCILYPQKKGQVEVPRKDRAERG